VDQTHGEIPFQNIAGACFAVRFGAFGSTHFLWPMQ